MQIKTFILFLLCFVVSKDANNETMAWNESRKLTWEDFKASPDQTSDGVALTASGITFGYSVKTSGSKIIDFSTSVEAHFYPNQSWYIKDKENAYVLAHEQLHFDITELYARKFRQQLSRLKVNRKIKEQMNRMHVEINEALNETQRRYDAESNHSINIEKQKYWENFIVAELKALEKYKSI